MRDTQIQIKVTKAEKERYADTAELYGLKLAAFARLAMEYIARDRPPLRIEPETEADPVRLNVGNEKHGQRESVFHMQ